MSTRHLHTADGEKLLETRLGTSEQGHQGLQCLSNYMWSQIVSIVNISVPQSLKSTLASARGQATATLAMHAQDI